MVLGGVMQYGTAGHLRGTEGIVHPQTYGGEWGWAGRSVPRSLGPSLPAVPADSQL